MRVALQQAGSARKQPLRFESFTLHVFHDEAVQHDQRRCATTTSQPQLVQEVFDRLKASCEAHFAEAAALQALASGRTSDPLLTPRRKMIEAFAREFGGFSGGSSPSRTFQPATPQQPPAGEREPP